MASLHKEKDRWVIRYKDEHEVWRKKRTKLKGPAGKRAARKHAEALVQGVERKRLQVDDPAIENAKVPLATYVRQFEQHLEASASTKDYRVRLLVRLRQMLRGIGATRVGHIRTPPVEELLNEMVRSGIPDRCLSPEELAGEEAEGRQFLRDRRKKPKATSTRDDYLDSLQRFCRWLEVRDIVIKNPLASIGHIHRQATDETFRRRAMTEVELDALLEAAQCRELKVLLGRRAEAPEELQEQKRLRGECRSMAYLLSATLGIRINALCQLVWGDVDLAESTIHLQARYAKNRKDAQPYMPDEVCDQLKAWKERLTSGLRTVVTTRDKVFPLLPKQSKNVKRLFDRDLAHAGVAAETEEGRLDVHALRTTAATRLYASGVDARVAASLLNVRVDVMQQRYERMPQGRVKAAVAQLPTPGYMPFAKSC